MRDVQRRSAKPCTGANCVFWGPGPATNQPGRTGQTPQRALGGLDAVERFRSSLGVGAGDPASSTETTGGTTPRGPLDRFRPPRVSATAGAGVLPDGPASYTRTRLTGRDQSRRGSDPDATARPASSAPQRGDPAEERIRAVGNPQALEPKSNGRTRPSGRRHDRSDSAEATATIVVPIVIAFIAALPW